MTSPARRCVVAIATTVEPALVDTLAAAHPEVDVDFDPALLPPMRWEADHFGDPDFRRDAAGEARFRAMLTRADVLYGIPGESPAALREVVAANPTLRWVQTMAAGGGAQVRQADLAPEDLARVAFTTSAGVHAGPLAEYALFGLLAGAKTLPRLLAQQGERIWSGRWAMGQLSEQTILVVGLGRIGLAVARKVHALGARVIATNYGPVDDPAVDLVEPPEALAELVGRADGIVLTLPDTPATRGMIDAAVLERVRPGVTLVNVGRGTVVVEEALEAALEDGRVGLAVLDVFAAEPLPAASPLWKSPNVLVSPHTAGLNGAEDRLIMELFSDNLGRFLRGEALVNRVDTVHFY